jgi:hypothetical protein
VPGDDEHTDRRIRDLPSFTVTVRVRIDRASDQQVRELMDAIPHALFDPMRRELVQTSSVSGDGARSALEKAVRRVTWALDDVGIRFGEYTITSAESLADDAET